MARPGLPNHTKFRRLVFLLKEPVPHVRGYLECLWDVAYENGVSRIGDVTDVELAAQWPGETGKLCKALLECGGDGRAGFIEQSESNGSEYYVHDLFDHAPDYVMDRSKREIERKKEKLCDYCGETYRSRYRNSKFCSDTCRQANHRKNVTANNGSSQEITERDGTPAPAPAPAPALSNSGPVRSEPITNLDLKICESIPALRSGLNTVLEPLPAMGLSEGAFAALEECHLSDTRAVVTWHARQLSLPDPVAGNTEADLLFLIAAGLFCSRIPQSEVKKSRVGAFVYMIQNSQLRKVTHLIKEAASRLKDYRQRSLTNVRNQSPEIKEKHAAAVGAT